MPNVARIHYEIPDDLHRQVKARAALDGLTLKDWLIATLERAVAESEEKRDR